MSRRKYRLSVFFLLLAALLLSACNLRKYIAATMRLVKTEGTVQVDNARGESVEIMKNLGLYSGYGVTTQAASYGWINLDETKLAKMDASSQVGILKKGKLLGIRGTSGWVEVEDKNRMSVYLLKGEVECTVFSEKDKVLVSETITAGQSARMVYDGEEAFITTEEFSDIPDFVEEAIMRKITGIFDRDIMLSDLGPLANLTNLKSGLGLDGNQISDISPLSGLTKLEKLYLHGNPIQDITPVLFVPELYYDEFSVDERPGAEEGEYPAYDYYSKGSPVTLNENGVVTGGAMNIVYHADPAASGGGAQN